MRRKDCQVRNFDVDAAKRGPLLRHYGGAQTVPVDRVVGSVGRAHELCPDFLPVNRAWRAPVVNHRYRYVHDALMRGYEMPPIDLYELEDAFYVVDGHRRMAAALSIGQLEIDATITRFRPVKEGEHATTTPKHTELREEHRSRTFSTSRTPTMRFYEVAV